MYARHTQMRNEYLLLIKESARMVRSTNWICTQVVHFVCLGVWGRKKEAPQHLARIIAFGRILSMWISFMPNGTDNNTNKTISIRSWYDVGTIATTEPLRIHAMKNDSVHGGLRCTTKQSSTQRHNNRSFRSGWFGYKIEAAMALLKNNTKRKMQRDS